MANSHIAFQLPVVIGSTNKSLRFKYVSTTYTATIDGVLCVGSSPLPATSWSWMTSDKN